MFESLTWNALLQQWPWFAAAGAVLVAAIGYLVVTRPRSPRLVDSNAAVDRMGWAATGRIDFTDFNQLGKFVLQAEEMRIAVGSTGVQRREVRWRSATIDEAKMVLESYNDLRNFAMVPTFTFSADTKPRASGQSEKIGSELKDAASGQDLANATLVPKVVPH
jgi:hypothetical protein